MERDEQGNVLPNPPLLERIAEDPILHDVKLIAEAWDAAGVYQVGRFPGRRWSEWNGRYRDEVRRFWRGDQGMTGLFASRLCGSSDLYQQSSKAPLNSINYVTCHDGFTLNDLVSYAAKHNQVNGHDNRDGADENFSANYGIEGPSDDPEIERLRRRQIKNMLASLMLSRGVPMLFGGKWGRMLAEHLEPLGLQIEVFDRDVGYVSAVKMCRSVMIKGIEALVVEAMTTAHEYGVEDQVIASLDETFPGLDWEKQAAYMASRVVKHGKRRAEEMREAAKAVADIGLDPLMASATAERQQWVADRVPSTKFDGAKPTLEDLAQVFRGHLKNPTKKAS